MTSENNIQFVDPVVSRAKFLREIDNYRQMEDECIKRGWWLVKAEFPKLFVVFGAAKVKPPMVAFGVQLDFTNYDLWPPSVCLIDPFTQLPYRGKELLPFQNLLRRAGDRVLPLMQRHDEENVPFLCLPGVREYHNHPAHSGDSWLLHRKGGEGTLYHLLNTIYIYGVGSIKAYIMTVNLQFNVVAESIQVQLEPQE